MRNFEKDGVKEKRSKNASNSKASATILGQIFRNLAKIFKVIFCSNFAHNRFLNSKKIFA
jgi:hypothetical protein